MPKIHCTHSKYIAREAHLRMPVTLHPCPQGYCTCAYACGTLRLHPQYAMLVPAPTPVGHCICLQGCCAHAHEVPHVRQHTLAGTMCTLTHVRRCMHPHPRGRSVRPQGHCDPMLTSHYMRPHASCISCTPYSDDLL